MLSLGWTLLLPAPGSDPASWGAAPCRRVLQLQGLRFAIDRKRCLGCQEARRLRAGTLTLVSRGDSAALMSQRDTLLILPPGGTSPSHLSCQSGEGWSHFSPGTADAHLSAWHQVLRVPRRRTQGRHRSADLPTVATKPNKKSLTSHRIEDIYKLCIYDRSAT